MPVPSILLAIHKNIFYLKKKECFQSIRNGIFLQTDGIVQVRGWTLDKQKSPNELVPYILS